MTLDPAGEDAFRAFVDARGAAYRRTAYLLCGDWDQADDLVQSALLSVYLSWPRLSDHGRLDAYVRRILVNTRRSWWRRAWRAEQPTGDVPDAAVGDAAVDQYDDRDRLVRALRLLPDRQRAAVVLRYYDGHTETEVADLLGVSVGTVKSHCARGLATLRRALGDLVEMTP